MGYTRQDLKTWVINLDRATERMERMSSQLDRLGIDFARFPAINGRDRADEFMPKVHVRDYERHMGQVLLPGKIGCYFSHLEVWRLLAGSEHPVGLIMEDDVVLHDDFPAALDLSLSAAEHWDLLRLNATRALFPITQGLIGDYRLNAYLGRFTGNGCYLVRRDVAQRLLPEIEEMKLAFEYEIGRFFAHDYRQYGLEPFPSHIDDGGVSQIVGKNNERLNKLRGLKKLPYMMTKILNYGRRLVYLTVRNRIVSRSVQLADMN